MFSVSCGSWHPELVSYASPQHVSFCQLWLTSHGILWHCQLWLTTCCVTLGRSRLIELFFTVSWVIKRLFYRRLGRSTTGLHCSSKAPSCFNTELYVLLRYMALGLFPYLLLFYPRLAVVLAVLSLDLFLFLNLLKKSILLYFANTYYTYIPKFRCWWSVKHIVWYIGPGTGLSYSLVRTIWVTSCWPTCYYLSYRRQPQAPGQCFQLDCILVL